MSAPTIDRKNQMRLRYRAKQLDIDPLTSGGRFTLVELREEGPYLWGYRLTEAETVAKLNEIARTKGANLDPVHLD